MSESDKEYKLIASFDIGTINLACCIFDENEKIHYWNIFDITAPTNNERCKKMVLYFNQVEKFKEITDVVIEHQPSFNPKAKVIQGHVTSYFLIKSVEYNKDINVITYSAQHKLNCYDGPCPDYSYLKSEYQQRKKLSIYHCSQIIIRPDFPQEQQYIDLFNSSKKKDDLADSFLQGLSYHRYNKEKMEQKFVTGKVTARRPTPKQYRYKKFSRPNLKFLLVEDLKKCQIKEDETETQKKKRIKKFGEKPILIDQFIKEWIEKRKGVKNSILSTYDLEGDPDIVKKDIAPEIYHDKGYTLDFVTYQKKLKNPKMKKKLTFEEEITVEDGL